MHEETRIRRQRIDEGDCRLDVLDAGSVRMRRIVRVLEGEHQMTFGRDLRRVERPALFPDADDMRRLHRLKPLPRFILPTHGQPRAASYLGDGGMWNRARRPSLDTRLFRPDGEARAQLPRLQLSQPS